MRTLHIDEAKAWEVLDALTLINQADDDRDFLSGAECYAVDKAITALREALAAQPAQQQFDHTAAANAALRDAQNRSYQIARAAQQQEPVTYWDLSENEMPVRPRLYDPEEHPNHVPPYTSPPAQHTWVGLTDGEIFKAIRPLYRDDITALAAIRIAKDEYRAIEAAHGIKEST